VEVGIGDVEPAEALGQIKIVRGRPGVADPGVGEPDGVAALRVDSGDGGARVEFAGCDKEDRRQDNGERE